MYHTSCIQLIQMTRGDSGTLTRCIDRSCWGVGGWERCHLLYLYPMSLVK